ncbi:hypothetical protein N798_00725 [Knoellia flava TL1]|uniref:Uncharacterized protein n=2 Tax=Knoellia flava TaxID=913969 RepID=A0A8H9KQT3_9MICO|nr:hypothetical protein [Knoellia flava]KGN36033.1 hypothetical protein N798_00725 [Knoellia flava TL1]GGB80625.1 hypothetical protein GCM10011314_20290 [Knoellia flava]
MRSRPPWAYAVLAALVVALAVGAAWLTRPSTEGLEGVWEAAAVDGEVLGGRALVATDDNVAVDLVSGTRITLGSVRGGTRAIGAGRLLVLRDDGPRPTLDGAGLDGGSRWTWQGPPAHRVTFVAAASATTVVQACGGTPVACRLIGVGTNGRESWQVQQPTASGTEAPAIGADGNLPTVGALPTKDGTVVLVDPTSSRILLRPPAVASVGRDGALTLSAPSGGDCRRTTFTTLDRSSTTTSPGSCDASPPASATDTTVRGGGRAHAWWWPFGDGHATLEVGGRHTGRVVGDDPLRALRVDDDGITVREGEVVRRYAWQR